MSPLEWFSVGVGVVSVLGVWLTGIALVAWPCDQQADHLQRRGDASSD
jgi:hypothetical protein